jgi:integrase/recombinase XerD
MKRKLPHYKAGQLEDIGSHIKGKDKDALDGFLKKCSITASPKKVDKIRKLLIQFYDVTEIPLTKQTKESVDSFLIILNNSDKSLWTIDELKVYIKQFLKYYYKDLELVENFKSSGKKQLNPKITENNLLTEEDLEKMLRQAESFKESAYLLVAFQTGARPQELIDIRWKDVKFEDGYADLTLYSSKTKTARTFPVVEKTMKALWDWKEHYSYPDVKPQDYVFPSRWRDKPMTSAGLNKMLRRLSKKAGLQKDVWGYLLRHSKATKLYEELPQQICEKLLGHKNMAGIYAHISSKKAREELLKKVYHIEELSPGKKHELELKIDQLQKNQATTNKAMQILIKSLTNKTGKPFAHNSSDEEELAILELSEFIERTPQEKKMWDENKVKLKNSLK